MHRFFVITTLLGGMSLACAAWAGPTSDILRGYEVEARQTNASFKPSAARGEALYRGEHVSAKGDGSKVSCSSCHTSDPRQPGLTRAHKRIEPLAPAPNPERFTEAAKVEKWFGRNCQDVLDRSCSAAEKADFIQWLLTLR